MSERMREDAAPPRVEALLRASRRDAFAPGFAQRVMRRVRDEQASAAALFGAVLQRQFLRLAPLAAAAVLALAGWNLRTADRRQSPVEAALGLPAVTADAALAVDSPAEEGRG
ncbi:hypothetical protein [Longimicrobium sp.]|uniref:hypothetical protein n=1 Tax=Longimicrobium sp. TaxID=2029185 RepID=UPI002CBD7484|nr:hypothetical protein [Longimicrobium sp.]HSU13670.1 hypothetical protein [Longimicrobium sp.]